MRRLVISWAAAAAACLCGSVHADDSGRLKELEQKLDAAQRALDALQKRLDALEKTAGPPSPLAPAATAATLERLDRIESNVAQAQAAAAAVANADTGLPLHGFMDAGGGVRNRAASASHARGFQVGTLDLYMTPQLGNQIKALIEVAFEANSEGETAVDVERLQLGYAFSDALTLWAGRFHTPYGYWNTAFHHGAQLQTALSRPRFLDFEDKGGILPAHSVGLWATGMLNTSAGKLGYDLYAVNGDRIHDGVLDFQASGTAAGSMGVGFRAGLTVRGTGLTVGAHGYRQRVTAQSGNDSMLSRLQMLGAYATYDDDDWEWMAEYYDFRNRQEESRRLGSQAWYIQVGRNLGEMFTPYLRYERTSLADADPYFALQEKGHSYKRPVLGLRFNVTPKSALKAEWTGGREEGIRGSLSTLAVQYSLRF